MTSEDIKHQLIISSNVRIIYDGPFLVVLSRPEDRRAFIFSFHASHLVQAIDSVMSLVFSVLDFVPAGSATSISTLQII